MIERKLDQALGLRARDQDIRRNAQRQPVELAFLDQVGNGLASTAPFEPPARGSALLRRELDFEVYHQSRSLDAEQPRKQQQPLAPGKAAFAKH